jgi:hypothetical protein
MTSTLWQGAFSNDGVHLLACSAPYIEEHGAFGLWELLAGAKVLLLHKDDWTLA